MTTKKQNSLKNFTENEYDLKKMRLLTPCWEEHGDGHI